MCIGSNGCRLGYLNKGRIFTDKNMVKKIIVLSASIIAIILLCNAKKITAYIDYNNGLEYLSKGDYKQAATVFYDNYNYRNSKYLYHFSQYMQKKNDSDGGYFDMYMIPESYKGEFSDMINEERNIVEPKHLMRLDEQAKKEKEREEKERAELKNKLPYNGMSVKYISDTLVGQYGKVSDGYDYKEGRDSSVKRYYWYSNDRRDIVLEVMARYDPNRYAYYVETVEKFNTDIYWTADGRPNFGAKRPAQTTSKRKYYDDEDYDVWGYDNPEDLYYDNPDMFEGYEEAYDFFYDMIEE